MSTNELTANAPQGISWRHYYGLTKPKVVLLIAFTALAGMLLSSPGTIPWPTLVFGLLGISLAAAAGAVVNHIIDQRIDAVMDRTQKRPIPSGAMDTQHALAFAMLLTLASILGLWLLVNPLTAMLTFFAFIGYAVIYTLFLKRSTPQNIVWGGLAGAAPPLLGWSAVTGEVTIESFILLLIIFIWTPPHFWPLAIKRREEYAKAGIPMLPVTHGLEFTKLQVLLYSVMLLAVSLMPFIVRMSGPFYLLCALVLGAGFIYHAVRLWQSKQAEYAMKTFGYSILYLSLLFTALLLDHYLG